jgi:adiponectin receptor
VATAIVVLFPQFRTPAWRPFRAFMFVAMGLSAVVPVFHGIRVFGVERLNQQMGLSWLVTQGFLYILGAGIYAVSGPPQSIAGIVAKD